MKNTLLFLTYFVGAGELILAVYFWATNSKSEVRRVMTWLTFSTGMWVLMSAMMAYRTSGLDSTRIIIALVYIFGIFLLSSLLHLVIIFPITLWRLDHLHKLLLYIPAVMLGTIALTTRLIENDFVSDANNAGKVVTGPLLPFYNFVLLTIFVIAVFVLFLQIKYGDGINRRHAQYFLWSVLIGGLPAVYIDLILPIISPNNIPNFLFGVLGSSVWLGTTAYLTLKH